MSKQSISKAIELGRIWMKKSVNIGHDYIHAGNVEKRALQIFQKLNNKSKLNNTFDEDSVILVSWWHDAYKSRKVRPSIWGVIFEGNESAKITRNEIGEYIEEGQLDKILSAIRWHNHPFLFFLFQKKRNLLGRILIEADGEEALRDERLQKQVVSTKHRSDKLGYILINWWKRFQLRLYK